MRGTNVIKITYVNPRSSSNVTLTFQQFPIATFFHVSIPVYEVHMCIFINPMPHSNAINIILALMQYIQIQLLHPP